MKESDVAALLPLKPVWFYVLLALGDGPRHGYSIGTAVEEVTDGGLRMWPATLYGTIHQLEERGLLERVDWEEGPEDDARRLYYQLTKAGRQVLAAETDRLRRLVKLAARVRALADA